MRAWFLAALALGLALACRDATPRPSILLISIDTLRADHLGLYGYARDTSPFLDRFARGALVFEHAFTPKAWTLPAHMTMLTGLYPEQHGVLAGDSALAPEARPTRASATSTPPSSAGSHGWRRKDGSPTRS